MRKSDASQGADKLLPTGHYAVALDVPRGHRPVSQINYSKFSVKPPLFLRPHCSYMIPPHSTETPSLSSD